MVGDDLAWRPTCSPTALRARADLLANTRRFFERRGVLEVETPLLSASASTDPNLWVFSTRYESLGQSGGQPLYLQTSPEFAMKRLLAAGSGSIYQICKAFRNGETGRHHNPEFTLLEWYRVGYSLAELMGEIEALLRDLCADSLELRVAERLAYREVFRRHVGLDPLAASFADLVARARSLELPEAEILCGEHRPAWLDLLFSYFIQPKLGAERISFVYDYPAILPSLARRCAEQPDLVERVEVFLGGLEIGNGFYELADAGEQTARFERDRVERQRNGLFVPDRDERLLAALRAGLPDCAGVAIGLDRLLMLLTGSESIDDVLAFPIERA